MNGSTDLSSLLLLCFNLMAMRGGGREIPGVPTPPRANTVAPRLPTTAPRGSRTPTPDATAGPPSAIVPVSDGPTLLFSLGRGVVRDDERSAQYGRREGVKEVA
jgi:hypothetical protein